MIRFIKAVGIVISFLIFNNGKLKKLTKLGETDQEKMEEESLRMVRGAFFKILKSSGVTVMVKGLENIPKDTPVLYVGNHRSYFDILVGYTTVPGRMGFVAKKEMRSWPLLSDWMVNVNCLFLDRKNVKEGLKTILEGVQKIKRGVSVWIFPEGTRNESEDPAELMPFKEGSLKIAEKAGCPVVPVALTGTAEVFEKQSKKIPRVCPGEVTIEFGKPFIIKELAPEERKFAGAYTRERIIEMLQKEK